MQYTYTGRIEIEGSGDSAEYEFESDQKLDALGQLDHMIQLGLLQIIPDEEN